METERARKYPFIPGTPALCIVGAVGNYLITDDGRRILDGAGGAVVNNIGYGRAEIADTAARAIRGGGYTLPTFATEARVRLIERLTDRWLPAGLTRCLFVSGGSESVDTAIRIARQHHEAKGNPNKWKVLGRSISYHGSTLASLSVGNHDRRRAGLGRWITDLPKIDVYDAELAAKVVEAEDPASIAAIIAEPVIGASGAAIVPPDDYWPALRRLCTDNDILLIADEVMTGFGRTGKKMGVDHWSVTPDLLVGAKGLAGGYAAIGGVFATDEVVEPLSEGSIMYFTFSGNDLACSIADRVLQIIEDEELVERSAVLGDRLRALLEDRLGEHPNVADIRGLGLLQGVELVKDRATGESFDGQLTMPVVHQALKRDCWIYPAGSAGVPDGLLFGPALTVSEHELEVLVDVAVESIDAAVAQLNN